ncbi:MAG: hypothetical protein ACREUT_19705 [Steroidobacteraceae bacterium]
MDAIAPSPLLLAPLLAMSLAMSPALARSGGTAIDGTLEVSVTGPALKHWGIPGAAAAFVPDADHSRYAQRIRVAANADELCTALAQAGGRDAAIASARVDGDGDLEHRSGDEMRLELRIGIAHLAAAARGIVYICSDPIVAVIARGNYPDERFVGVAGQRFRWASPPLTLHRGKKARVRGTASVDASRW